MKFSGKTYSEAFEDELVSRKLRWMLWPTLRVECVLPGTGEPHYDVCDTFEPLAVQRARKAAKR